MGLDAIRVVEEYHLKLRGSTSSGEGEEISSHRTLDAAMLELMKETLGMEAYVTDFDTSPPTSWLGMGSSSRWRLESSLVNLSNGNDGPPPHCRVLHSILRSRRGDGKEALVLVTPMYLSAASGINYGMEWKRPVICGPDGPVHCPGAYTVNCPIEYQMGSPFSP